MSVEFRTKVSPARRLEVEQLLRRVAAERWPNQPFRITWDIYGMNAELSLTIAPTSTLRCHARGTTVGVTCSELVLSAPMTSVEP